MDYITVVGEIVKCGAIKQQDEEQSSLFTYESIEIKRKDNGETVQTGEITVTDNVNTLLAEGTKGTFVLGKSNKAKVVVAIKTGNKQALLMEHASVNNMKGANVLKTMSTLGFVAAAFGLSQIWGGYELSKSLLLMLCGVLLGVVTGVQPIVTKRLRKQQIEFLTEAGFDMSGVSATLSDVADSAKKAK